MPKEFTPRYKGDYDVFQDDPTNLVRQGNVTKRINEHYVPPYRVAFVPDRSASEAAFNDAAMPLGMALSRGEQATPEQKAAMAAFWNNPANYGTRGVATLGGNFSGGHAPPAVAQAAQGTQLGIDPIAAALQSELDAVPQGRYVMTGNVPPELKAAINIKRAGMESGETQQAARLGILQRMAGQQNAAMEQQKLGMDLADRERMNAGTLTPLESLKVGAQIAEVAPEVGKQLIDRGASGMGGLSLGGTGMTSIPPAELIQAQSARQGKDVSSLSIPDVLQGVQTANDAKAAETILRLGITPQELEKFSTSKLGTMFHPASEEVGIGNYLTHKLFGMTPEEEALARQQRTRAAMLRKLIESMAVPAAAQPRIQP